MNIQALDIKAGDCAPRTAISNRIVAYCKQKMQPEHDTTVTNTKLDPQQHHTESIPMCG